MSLKLSKMNKLIVLFLIFTSSCSSEPIRVFPKKRGVDPAFNPYIKEYYSIINFKNKTHKDVYVKRIKNLSMNFTELEEATIGRCYWLLNGELEIEVDKKYWDRSGFLSKKFLVYHELEHCIRNRSHTHDMPEPNSINAYIDYLIRWLGIIPKKDYFSDGCPNSIMHPNDVGDWCHYNHYNKYIEEMMDYKDSSL